MAIAKDEKAPKADGTAPLWGGGFEESMHPALARISESIEQDMPLCDADLRGSAAYARALGRCGVLSDEEGQRLARIIEELLADFRAGRWVPAGTEDVHTAIEAEVTRRAGDLGGRLHTGRSRNDQVSTAFRLAVAERTASLIEAVRGLQRALIDKSESELETFVPSYTHMQRAQPIRLAHWLMGHMWPLQRDVERLEEARRRALVLPLGSGAVSGHPFGIDREAMAAELGFVAVTDNSIDTVGDRDFAVEVAFACSLLAMHLSRLAEELVMWTSSEFGYVRWPDSLATGSSLMPNKKNPDLAELVRGRASSTVGDVTTLLVLLKGLPSSYQRDLQEDKPPVWRVTANVRDSLTAMTAAMQGISFDRERMAESLSDDLLATEAADVLVARGLPFRQAHGIVAKVAAEARKRGCGLKEVARAKDWALPAPLTPADMDGLQVEVAVERRVAPGGTGRQAVVAQIAKARQLVGSETASGAGGPIESEVNGVGGVAEELPKRNQ